MARPLVVIRMHGVYDFLSLAVLVRRKIKLSYSFIRALKSSPSGALSAGEREEPEIEWRGMRHGWGISSYIFPAVYSSEHRAGDDVVMNLCVSRALMLSPLHSLLPFVLPVLSFLSSLYSTFPASIIRLPLLFPLFPSSFSQQSHN